MNTSWPTLTEAVFACEKCRLCQTRTNVVLGEGDLHAPLMFIGEGPGQQEDETGRPFVGAAGQKPRQWPQLHAKPVDDAADAAAPPEPAARPSSSWAR